MRSYDNKDPVRTRVPAQRRAPRADDKALSALPKCPDDDAPALAWVHLVLPAGQRDGLLDVLTIRTSSPPDPAPGICLRKVNTWRPIWPKGVDDLRRTR